MLCYEVPKAGGAPVIIIQCSFFKLFFDTFYVFFSFCMVFVLYVTMWSLSVIVLKKKCTEKSVNVKMVWYVTGFEKLLFSFLYEMKCNVNEKWWKTEHSFKFHHFDYCQFMDLVDTKLNDAKHLQYWRFPNPVTKYLFW